MMRRTNLHDYAIGSIIGWALVFTAGIIADFGISGSFLLASGCGAVGLFFIFLLEVLV